MILVANWKAYVETLAQVKKLVLASKKISDARKHEVILAVPGAYLGLLSVGNKTRVKFAGQNVSDVSAGAHTGEVTAGMLRGAGATHVIIGHSERRAQGETDELLVRKVKQAIRSGLTPIVCVGESERDEQAHYLAHLRTQVTSIFAPLSAKDRTRLVLAYEPVWAIGKSASEGISPEDLTEMVSYLRKVLSTFFPGKGAENVPILYGGAVEPSNAKALTVGTGVQGLLVGHASAQVSSFSALAKALS